MRVSKEGRKKRGLTAASFLGGFFTWLEDVIEVGPRPAVFLFFDPLLDLAQAAQDFVLAVTAGTQLLEQSVPLSQDIRDCASVGLHGKITSAATITPFLCRIVAKY
ncbi:hypothetical protein, partial [Thermodesulfitimonas autotrophica]|uniref:hypothetical protein n=1 Tax=Thermodesulfitimonas autotrophica TaxID=1894989 RepID=UPI002FDFBDD8